MQNNLQNKKIGIWGFGVVGKSAYDYFNQFTDHIQVMDKTKQEIPDFLLETPEHIQQFLQNNDYILASPGIALHNYQEYDHKFISELDIIQKEFHHPTIAITGTAGKTTITHLLNQCIPNSIAAGNIGYAMLNLLTELIKQTAVLELSSFQLQQTKTFAPDLALLINLYPNHLDQHKNEDEYFAAKCNIFKHQKHNQIALLPCSLIQKVQKQINIQSKFFLFCDQQCSHHAYPTFTHNQQMIFLENKVVFHNLDKLNPITYQQNWFIIIAMLYLAKIDTNNLVAKSHKIKPQEHRLEKFATYNNCDFYNDSKSTVWQTTHMALNVFPNKKTALFFGGLSKGTDRSPLFELLKNKDVEIFLFGAEILQLQKLCTQNNIVHFADSNLEQAVQRYRQHMQKYDIVLLSPGGTSFDLYKNYKERGSHFKTLIQKALEQH